MKISNFWKGLIAAIIGFIASYIADAETINYYYVAIYTVGFTVVYIAKNAVFPSISVFGTIDLRDLLSGLILAIGSGLVAYAAQVITADHVAWKEIWQTVWVSVLAYLGTKFGFTPKK